MFSRVGRRLAILNALTVFALIALLGALAFFALRHNLTREMDRSLSERIESLEIPTEPAEYARPAPPGNPEPGSAARDVLASGDTVVLVFNPQGEIVRNPRGIQTEQLPVEAGLTSALAGDSDLRTVDIAGGVETVRVLSVPVVADGEVVGVVQAVRSTRELQGQLEDLAWTIVLGIILALVVSAPAGLYLASRAMGPINLAFDHQRQFVADASHELRTPMTLIRANTEMALIEAPPEAAHIEPELRSVLHEVDNIDRLISDLMLVARLDSGMLEIEREEHDLAAAVGEAVEEMRPLFDERGVELHYVNRGSLPALIDRGRISQVVRILLDNARKHTEPGGRVCVTVEGKDRAGLIAVSDTGSGIPPEHLERIFDRFYRVDRARSRQSGGTGLGLSIAKAITDAHNGEISLESQPGEGTTARVSLPLARPGAMK